MQILILGAGRSSNVLIRYLLTQAEVLNFTVVVGDVSLQHAEESIFGHSLGTAVQIDVANEDALGKIIADATIVISMLPAALHPTIALHCLAHGKHLLTASYVSKEMQALHQQALEKNLVFLNECGLDPGLDHMSAMKLIQSIHDKGGIIESFESFTGGLLAPTTDPENPWHYKFTWNPRNVVMAGQSTAQYLEQGEYKYIPYQQLFKRTTRVEVSGLGLFEGYANRDSLPYKKLYGLENLHTIIRGTLRHAGFCNAWNVLVQLGCCDDSMTIGNVEQLTHKSFINSFLPYHASHSVEEKLQRQLNIPHDGIELQCLHWSGFFDNEPLGITTPATPAQITEHILSKRWKLDPDDKDMIVMWHRLRYQHQGVSKEVQAHIVVEGTGSDETAMAKTVGLPLGIAAVLILKGKVTQRGVLRPLDAELYEPILNELKVHGVSLVERDEPQTTK